MKKVLAALLILTISLGGCSINKSNNISSADKEQAVKIDYYTIFEDFVTYGDANNMPKEGAYVFKYDGQWDDFKKMYFMNVSFSKDQQFPNISLDITDTNLICSVLYPSKPIYVPESYIKNIELKGKNLYLYTDPTGVIKQTSGTNENTIYVILTTLKQGIIKDSTIAQLK